MSKEMPVDEILQKASSGDANAQCLMGRKYLEGDGVIEDFAEALQWYRKAADQGVAEGQDMVGYMIGEGIGVTQNNLEAVKWHRKAAEQGLGAAQLNLSVCYYNGAGVIQDFIYAHVWSNLAAALGTEGADEMRKRVAEKLSFEQITEAQRIAREYLNNDYKDC